MATLQREITYFTPPGPNNTDKTLALARERMAALGLRSVLVATTTGQTGLQAARTFRGYSVVAVTHSTGFRQPNMQEAPSDVLQAIRDEGAAVLTCQHAFGGVGRAVRMKLGTYELDEIVAYTLRLFGEGMKVAVEITLMAADAGLVHTGEEVMAIAGTGRGADTAVVLRAANAMRFFDLGVVEIVCMPGGHLDQAV
ncbi:MAG: hypothetical protein HPY83_12475 [Anaerolineae bacterium]|nr:hypothetical protein [Anaerolineae bacterium]